MTSSLDFSSLFDASPAPCAVLDPALRIVAANRAYLAAMACAREDIVGRDWFDAFPDNGDRANPTTGVAATGPSDVEATFASPSILGSVLRAQATRQADTLPLLHYPIPARHPIASGAVYRDGDDSLRLDRYWRMTHTPVYGADGALAYLLQHCTDVTLMQRPTPALDAQRTQMIEALQRDRTDLEGRVRESVQALRDSESERLQTAAALAQAQKMEAVGKLTGGVAHDFNNVLQIISGNVQLAERDLRIVQDRLDTVGNEGAVLSARVTAAHSRLGTALEAVARGAKLASQLLAFARRQPLQPTVVEPRALCLPMVDMMRRLLGETIQVETRIPDGVPPALVDANQLENVLLNLAVNARDAMDGEGTLTICVENAVIDSGVASLHPGLRPGEYVMFALMDTGCGMPRDVLDRVFEPFYTTKPPGQGTGLGLSMAYGFAKQSNGHIYIDSVVGEGTSVRLYLPRAAQDAVRPGARPVAGELDVGAKATDAGDLAPPRALEGGAGAEGAGNIVSASRPGARTAPQGERHDAGDASQAGAASDRSSAARGAILVAEDDRDVRETVAALIEGLGYPVIACDSGEAAIEILRSPRGVGIALLFSDVVMPGPLRGAALLSAVRAARPNLPVMFTSGYTDEELAHGGRLDPTVALLAKPYDQARLAQTLGAMLGVPRQSAVPVIACPDDDAAALQTVPQAASAVGRDLENRNAGQPVPTVGAMHPARRGLLILLVEDDDNAREATAALLEALGHRVLTAENGESAILALSGSRPDLLVTDLNLPGMSGAELVQRIDLPAVMISGMALTAGGAVMSLGRGAPAASAASPESAAAMDEDSVLPTYVVPLSKPFDLDALTDAIDAALLADRGQLAQEAHPLSVDLSGHPVPVLRASARTSSHASSTPSATSTASTTATPRREKSISSLHSPRGRAGHV